MRLGNPKSVFSWQTLSVVKYKYMPRVYIEDLPPQLAEIAEVIGLESTIKLAQARGGQSFWIALSIPNQGLVEIMGANAAQDFQKIYGGGPIECNTLYSAVHSAICRDVLLASKGGKSIGEICQQYQISRSRVRAIIKKGGTILACSGAFVEVADRPRRATREQQETVIKQIHSLYSTQGNVRVGAICRTLNLSRSRVRHLLKLHGGNHCA
jgi:Mor family transcriptional regulator